MDVIAPVAGDYARATIVMLALLLASAQPAIARQMMNAKADQSLSPVEKSMRAYEAIFDDIRRTYRDTGGGGITTLREIATGKYQVEFSQEGRKDIFVYTIDSSKAGPAAIVDKTSTTKSY